MMNIKCKDCGLESVMDIQGRCLHCNHIYMLKIRKKLSELNMLFDEHDN